MTLPDFFPMLVKSKEDQKLLTGTMSPGENVFPAVPGGDYPIGSLAFVQDDDGTNNQFLGPVTAFDGSTITTTISTTVSRAVGAKIFKPLTGSFVQWTSYPSAPTIPRKPLGRTKKISKGNRLRKQKWGEKNHFIDMSTKNAPASDILATWDFIENTIDNGGDRFSLVFISLENESAHVYGVSLFRPEELRWKPGGTYKMADEELVFFVESEDEFVV